MKGKEVVGIATWGFQSLKGLSGVVVTLPDTVTRIGNYAFEDTGLFFDELDLTGVTYVGGRAFYGNTVKSLYVNSSIRGFDSSWKYGMTIETVYVPDSVSNYTSWFNPSIIRQIE